MKSKSSLSAKRLFRPFHVLAIVLVMALMLASCATPVQTPTPTVTLPEPTVTLTETLTPTEIIPAATRMIRPTKTFDYWDSIPEISETQEPIVISKSGPMDPEYLYKDVIVTFKTPWVYGDNYLNLDDLSDSTPDNSDIILDHGTGSQTYYELFAANDATYYSSGLYGMNYNTCLEHFPFTAMDSLNYLYQGNDILSGRDYCILTAEGHLAILHLEPSSQYLQSADENYLMPELVVTVYKKIVSLALTPYPIETPALTPELDRYAGVNLTRSQENGLDKAAQTFLDIVNSGDRKAVANLMLYPLTINDSSEYYGLTAKNQDDFLSVYGEVFTPQVIREFKSATVSQNMGVHFGGMISLVVPHCAVLFYPDGNIYAITENDQGMN
jgi:hypothetical protein